MKKPQYCFQFDTLRITFNKGGLLSKAETVVEFLQGYTVVQTKKMEGITDGGFTLSGLCAFVGVEPPSTYTVDDLMAMLAEKKGESLR